MPGLLAAAELARIQSDLVAAACDKTCVIQRRTRTKDPYGQATEVFATIATTVAGMRQPSAGELQNYAFRIEDKAAWTVQLPVGTTVATQDQLVIEGQTLEVHVLLTPKSYPGLLSVIAAELTP